MKKLRIPTKFDYFASSSMSNQEMFAKIIELINFVGKIDGCNIFADDFTPFNFALYWTVSNVFAHLVLTVHNVYYYGDDLFRFCFLMVTTASCTQGLPMLQTFLHQREKIKNLVKRIEKFLGNYNTKKANEIFEKWILRSCHCGLVLAFLIASCGILVAIYPIGFFIVFKEKIRHFGFELPWVDWETPMGYTLNFIYSIIIIYIFVFALYASAYLSILIIVMSFGQFEIIEMLIDELNQLITSNEKGENNLKIKKIIA